MATSTIPNPNVIKENLIVDLANSNVITHTAGTPVGYRYGNQMICYISLAFKTTQQRAADLGVFRLRTSDNKQIVPTTPYFLPCMVNSDNVMRWCFKGSDSGAYFVSPVTWNANAEFRITGAFVGDIQ